jgi:hypothetical protein
MRPRTGMKSVTVMRLPPTSNVVTSTLVSGA